MKIKIIIPYFLVFFLLMLPLPLETNKQTNKQKEIKRDQNSVIHVIHVFLILMT